MHPALCLVVGAASLSDLHTHSATSETILYCRYPCVSMRLPCQGKHPVQLVPAFLLRNDLITGAVSICQLKCGCSGLTLLRSALTVLSVGVSATNFQGHFTADGVESSQAMRCAQHGAHNAISRWLQHVSAGPCTDICCNLAVAWWSAQFARAQAQTLHRCSVCAAVRRVCAEPPTSSHYVLLPLRTATAASPSWL